MIEDEESLRMYVDESFEHMSNIENNLLEIEKAGENADEDLVNEVFRAAHSIKGGAGLMGLNKIKELSHKVENVLGMIREQQIYPDSNIINIILNAFDKLHNMISNIKESEEYDISEEVVSLTGLTTASLPTSEKSSVTNLMTVLSPTDGKPLFQATQFDLDKAQKGGKGLYLVEWDLINDIFEQGRTLPDMITSISGSGDIIDARVEVEKVGTLEETLPSSLPLHILFSTMIGVDILASLFNVSKKNIHPVTDALIQPADASRQEYPPAESSSDQSSPSETVSYQTGPDESDAAADLTPQDIEKSPAAEATDSKEAVTAGAETAHPPSATDFETEAGETGKPADTQKPQPNDTVKDDTIKTSMMQTSLRVDVKLLDNLMTLAGEMVLSRNQLLQSISANDMKTITSAGQRINMVTSELQDVIMRTRMQSIGNIFNKFPRLVRDMSQNLGKKVELSLEGTDVELDKTIIEAISDPLTHLIRNSVDHGIEPPGKRKSSGKNIIGKIHISALHEAGQVSIEITDDGQGIDGDRIAAVAVQKGLLSEQDVAGMSNKEKMELILMPGFSTSEKVTDLSGRGVGMDVVKTNLEKLGGTMDIDSVPERYTAINIKLPLTLAIIPSQIVLIGEESYAIPQVNLDELLRIPADQIKHRIERVGDAEVVRLRGKLLPLVDLADILGLEKKFIHPKNGQKYREKRRNIADRRSKKLDLPSDEETKEAAGEQEEPQTENTDPEAFSRRFREDRRFHASSAINIAVVFMGDIRYGLVVDRLLDSEEIVVKPLGQHLKTCQEFSGATIMGDGRVALILDIAGIANSARLNMVDISRKEKKEIAARKKEEEEARTDHEVTSLLLFSHSGEEQFAVSLSLVERIESIKTTDIEYVGGKKIMQYRGGALPLFSLDNVADVQPLPETEEIEIIVFTIGGRELGLMVAPPVDAVEVPITIDSNALKQKGIMGSAIIYNKTTLVVDIFEAVQALYPDWMGNIAQRQINQRNKGTLLFAEDSDFFRRQVKGFLEDDGYHIIEAKDGVEAWDILQKRSGEIDLVITDLEMPNMDGFEFTKKIRADDRFHHFVVIALTSLAGEEDIVKGKQVGINDYQIKMDREKLLECVKHHIEKR